MLVAFLYAGNVYTKFDYGKDIIVLDKYSYLRG